MTLVLRKPGQNPAAEFLGFGGSRSGVTGVRDEPQWVAGIASRTRPHSRRVPGCQARGRYSLGIETLVRGRPRSGGTLLSHAELGRSCRCPPASASTRPGALRRQLPLLLHPACPAGWALGLCERAGWPNKKPPQCRRGREPRLGPRPRPETPISKPAGQTGTMTGFRPRPMFSHAPAVTTADKSQESILSANW
jgi:hypothetical protein